MPDGSALMVQGIAKAFQVKASGQRVQALQDVSLTMAAGTLTALVGPDGAGKTTLLRLAAGLMRPDAGTLRVLGLDVVREPQAVQDRISYMPQRFGLYEDLSVQENLDLYADLHGVRRAERGPRYKRLMEMTDLASFTGRPAGKLSGGMKQKLGLACTLVRSPDLLLLDEPTVGVDPLSRRELWAIVQQLVEQERLSVVVSTAYLDEAERCAQVFVLHEGRLLASGAPETLRAHADGLCATVDPPVGQPARQLQARLLDAPGLIVDAVPRGGRVRFVRRHRPASADPEQGGMGLDALLDGLPVASAPARLEDGFMVLLRARDAGEHGSRDTGGAASGQGQPGPGAEPAAGAAQAPDAAGARAAPARGATPGGNDDTVIEVRDLVRRFGDFTAVASTTFTVRRGEIFGLLGPNGAGKTTTFRMLCGLLPASGGTLRVAGVDLRTARAQARARIGYVSQKFALYGHLTVRENLEFFGGAYGLWGQALQARMHAVLTQFDLLDMRDMPSGQLPGGYKQRLAMATGLLHEPEILFLDEPTSGADPLARREFWRRITALAASGVTVVITTHFMEEAEYCDRIVIQDAGKVLALGTPQAVRKQAGQDGRQVFDMEAAFIAIVEQARQVRQAPA